MDWPPLPSWDEIIAEQECFYHMQLFLSSLICDEYKKTHSKLKGTRLLGNRREMEYYCVVDDISGSLDRVVWCKYKRIDIEKAGGNEHHRKPRAHFGDISDWLVNTDVSDFCRPGRVSPLVLPTTYLLGPTTTCWLPRLSCCPPRLYAASNNYLLPLTTPRCPQ